MTENAIVEKLRVALSDAVDSEYKVVYILAESRKLLETYPPDPVPFALKIYCHWALHVDLDKPGTTSPFLKQVDEYVGSILSGKQDIPLEYRMCKEFVLLNTFREQFRTFLRGYGLPTAVCDEDARWHQFLKSYAGIIEDGSLSCRAKAPGLNHIREVTFNKGKPARPDSYLSFGFSWSILLLDGRTMTVDVEAGQYIGGGIEGIFPVISVR
jgi:hypothetical protein